jgi:hypothetical protein
MNANRSLVDFSKSGSNRYDATVRTRSKIAGSSAIAALKAASGTSQRRSISLYESARHSASDPRSNADEPGMAAVNRVRRLVTSRARSSVSSTMLFSRGAPHTKTPTAACAAVGVSS